MEKLNTIVHSLPEKKPYLEVVSAVLTVPIMITVLIMNVNNLRKPAAPTPEAPKEVASAAVPESSQTPTPTKPRAKQTPGATPTPTKETLIVVSPTTTTPQPTLQCTKEVGPVDIASPSEGATVTGDPVCIDITRKGSNYCEVAWSYRINGDPWSEYMNKSICLYNLSAGKKTIEVRVKSIASSDETILKRTFTVQRAESTPTASPSATTQ